jgi:hypothetical protein
MQRPAESSGERDQWRATGRRRRLVPFNECSSPLVMVCCLASGCRAGQLEPTPYRPSRVNLDSLRRNTVLVTELHTNLVARRTRSVTNAACESGTGSIARSALGHQTGEVQRSLLPQGEA